MANKISNSLQSLDTIGIGAVIPVSDSVATLTASIDSKAEYIELQIQTADIRATFDGTDPNPENGVGFIFRKDQILTLDCNDARSMKLTREDTDAAVYFESKSSSN